MYKVEILSDTLRDAAINRRKHLDAERKKRIFDPKIRVFGIDVQALEDQMRTKERIKREEQQREEAFDKAMREANLTLAHLEAEAAAQARSELERLNQFRSAHQHPTQRRDYDLYDPLALRKDRPGRIGDDDQTIGLSSCQRFEGEDLAQERRKKLQKEQIRAWTNEQVWERRMKKAEEAEEKSRYEQYQNDVDQKVLTLQKAVQEARQAQARADEAFNRQQAQFKKEREAERRRHEEQQSIDEVNQQVNGRFLTEQPDVFNIRGGHQVRVDDFKGITREQQEYIAQVQAKQRADLQTKREEERQEAQRIARQDAANIRAAMLLEREKVRRQREDAARLLEENREKAGEQKAKQHYINHVLYTNEPTDAFFLQFNTTSR
ncbi:RIB43A-domain-containing protein [Fimicolochytrium jonesii]|uniref:RIB43A-domain-containing protein n=1 Tax=Fimicolochytrium jonesii TaxID=1396493 RepID=UPI0022FE31EC|nr:RIB43A-domain-containing protein [Fimicolochytrium jonesii]KAI8821790.1 RIB43A-domain-containing protein [Fimicolochytrium jonesii]